MATSVNKTTTSGRACLSVNTAEAAEMLGISAGTLQNWRYLGQGPKYARVGGNRVLYPIAELKKWLDEHMVDGL